MNKKLIIIITTTVSIVLAVVIGLSILNYSKQKGISNVANKFMNDHTGQTDSSIFTADYLNSLSQDKQNYSVDQQSLDSAYAGNISKTEYTGITDVNINGSTATCVATANVTTTSTDGSGPAISIQKYKLTLKMVDGNWEIDSAELLSSVTKLGN